MKNLFIIFSIFLLSCSENMDQVTEVPKENLSTTVEYNQIDGVDPNLLSLDIYYTNLIETKKPIIIWVHGGGWTIGDKGGQIENKMNLFQSLGYILISVNYRLSPYPFELDNPNRVMYPMHNNDVADAIKWTYDNISKYGGDTNKIALLGHSAGAQLVSLIGTNSSFLKHVGLDLEDIKGVASIDTEGYNVVDKIADNNELYINAFGLENDSNIQASPILNIENGVSYPHFFVAKRGTADRIESVDKFISALEQNGVTVSHVDGSIYDHSGINKAIGLPNETLVTDALLDFLKICFQ